MGTRSVHLTDDELAHLDGRCSDKVQAEVDGALRRIAARGTYADLTPELAGLVADVVAEAKGSQRLRLLSEQATWCPLCRKRAGYAPYKSGPRRGEPNRSKPRSLTAYEFSNSAVRVVGHIHLGGCRECVDPILPVIAEALRGVEAELPDRLRAEGEPRRVRHADRHCRSCDWDGHEGQMTRKPTILGDGTYPAACPECGASGGGLFEHDPPVEHTGSYTVVEVEA